MNLFRAKSTDRSSASLGIQILSNQTGIITRSKTMKHCTCGKENTIDMIRCESCNKFKHYSCAGITEQDANCIEYFFCDFCENEKGFLTSWPKRTPNEDEQSYKDSFYFEIESIIDHKIESNTRFFKIRWKNYGEKDDSWEPEIHLDAAIDLLQSYLHKHNMHSSQIKGLLGSNKFEENGYHNLNNWVTIQDISQEIEFFRNFYTRESKIPVKIFTGKLDKMTNEVKVIYLLSHEHHAYVILYKQKEDFAYICDGANVCIKDYVVAKELRHILKCRLVYCQYDKATRIDNCGAAAVTIAIEFLRGKGTRRIKPLQNILNQATKRLHKETSAKCKSKYRHQPLRCGKCGKTFKMSKSSHKRLLIHQTHCRS